jgi:hypothetical protein
MTTLESTLTQRKSDAALLQEVWTLTVRGACPAPQQFFLWLSSGFSADDIQKAIVQTAVKSSKLLTMTDDDLHRYCNSVLHNGRKAGR